MKVFPVLLLILSLFICSCEKAIINRGYLTETADFSKITVGKDDAQFVFRNFGSPTIRSTIADPNNGYSWYYISKRIEKTGPLDPKILEQKTIRITFDTNNIVTAVKETKYEEQNIKTVDETTKTKGKTKGIVGETFGGLGKYLKRYTEKGK
jgi:outer membrane protein assembly factor BamE (lipoprotein component of BamABCDE complex)